MNDVAVLSYAVYEDDTQYLGITQVTLPSLSFMTQTINGAGIAGEFETILIGQMSAMELSLQHRILTAQGIALSEPRIHNIELREVQQKIDNSAGLSVTSVKHVMKIMPKAMPGGTLQTNNPSNPSMTYSVVYWAEYRDGELAMELDPLNNICRFGDTDYLEEVRNALGMG